MSEKTFKIVNGDISDGYHTFDELYDHRCLLFCNLCVERNLDSGWSREKAPYPGWFLLFTKLKTGKQISYHIPDKYFYLIDRYVPEDNSWEWDGHTSGDVVQRLVEELK